MLLSLVNFFEYFLNFSILGLVQAVDETDHLLYIISPLKKHEWTKVNAIIKGNVMMPDALILQQVCIF